MNDIDGKEPFVTASGIIQLWKNRPELQKKYKSIFDFWNSLVAHSHPNSASRKVFDETFSVKRLEETKTGASSAKAEPAGRSVSTPIKQTASDDIFERLFIQHTNRMLDLRVNNSRLSAVYPELVSELETAVQEMSAAWTENDIEKFKAAILKTERIYKKAKVITEEKHPLL